MDSESGSLQEFIPDAQTYFAADSSVHLQNEDQKFAIWIFYYLIWNSDRHGSNLLIKDNRIYAIDHEASFRNIWSDKYEEIEYGRYYDKEIPGEIVDRIETFLQDDFRQKLLKRRLNELLYKEEVEAFFRRVEHLGKILKVRKILRRTDLNNYSPDVT